jgi:hypothetical protein
MPFSFDEHQNNLKFKKGILFVDFNGVISYDPFWKSMIKNDHPLHCFYEPIENYLFRNKNSLIDDWMLGKYTSEQIHQILADKIGIPYQPLFEIFSEDCKKLDMSKPILKVIQALKKDWYWDCLELE